MSILKEGYSLHFKVRPPSGKVAFDSQWLCKPGQKQAPKRVFTGANPKTGSKKGYSSIISGLLQLVVSGTKAQQQVEAHPRSQSSELIPSTIILQEGNSRDHQALPSISGVGHLAGFQRRLFSYSNKSKVAEVPKIPSQQSNFSVYCTSFWPVDGSVGVHKGRQGSQVDGTGMARHTQTLLARPGLGGQSFKIRTDPTAGIQLCRPPFRPLSRSVQTHSGEGDSLVTENQPSVGTRDLFCQAVHVPNRADSHRKTGSVGTASYETHSMAFKETLACLGSPGKARSPAKISSCSPEVVVGPKQCSKRSTVTPITSRPPTVYRCLKQMPGRTLRRLHCKRPLVQTRRHLAHKLSRAQSGFGGHETVLAFVLGSDHPGLHRQHNRGFLHQQGGRYEIMLSLCPPLETPVVVQPETNTVMGQTHSGSLKCYCGQTVQTQTGDSDGVVSPAGDFRPTLPEVAHTGSGLICNPIQSQTYQVCVTGLNWLAWKINALSLQWEDLDPYAYPPVAILGQVVTKLLDQGCCRMILIAPG